MTIALPGAPFPVTYRELWLPHSINSNATLPSSVEGGHELALTGAQKRTTCDGAHGDGSATSNINCGVIHNNVAKFWGSVRFKFDQDFPVGAVTRMLCGKRVDDANRIVVSFDIGNGRLILYQILGGVVGASLESAETTWNAGQWYHVLFSVSDTAGGIQRLIIDGGVPVTDTLATQNLPAAGSLIIGDQTDPGTGQGFEGVIADVFVGTDDLTIAEEDDLYNGTPTADTVNEYLLDEGRGITAYDRGSGGNNGTLDTSVTWKFGQVEQPVLSLDCHNDHAQTVAGVNISGDLTLVWVGKMKSIYSGLSSHLRMWHILVDANNYSQLLYRFTDDDMWYVAAGGGVTTHVNYAPVLSIDDYAIIIGTQTVSGVMSLFWNGSLVGTTTGLGVVSAGAATAYLGSSNALTDYDISKPLLVALVDGAFTQKQALAYSRYIKNIFNLPISI